MPAFSGGCSVMNASQSMNARVCRSSNSPAITSQALSAARRSQRRPSGSCPSRSCSGGPQPIGVYRYAPNAPFARSYSSTMRRKAFASLRENLANSAHVRSRSRHWVSHVPSGKGMCTTGSGFRYSSPYSPSCSSSSRNVGLAWIRLCAVEQVSCRKPGNVSSSVAVSPPMIGRVSSTQHSKPARVRYAAATSALWPPPATTTSNDSLIR